MPRGAGSRFQTFVRSRAAVDREVAGELSFHLEMAMRDLMRQGMSEAAARAEAARRFGDQATVDAACRRLARERDRQRSRAEWFDELRQDAAFALRQLARAPGFALIAICTLGLGIGATACVFSVLRAVVLAPLPFANAQRLVTVIPTNKGTTIGAASGMELTRMRGLTAIFDGVAAQLTGTGFTYMKGAEPVVISTTRVTSNLPSVLGVRPELGRLFLPGEDQPGARPVVVLTHRIWLDQFAGDSAVLGRTMRLDGTAYQIIGVLPAALDMQRNGDLLWVPLTLSSSDLADTQGREYQLTAKLRAGVSIAGAASAASAVERDIVHTAEPKVTQVGMAVEPLVDQVVGDYRQRLLVLFGAVGFVLLIACVNVANLLLARGATRSTELAIRAALGAGKARLVRQMLVETLLLALLGGAAGIAAAEGLVRALVSIAPDGVPRLDQAGVNGIVLLFSLCVALGSSVLVGVMPALRGASAGAQAALRDAGRWSRAGGRHDRVRSVLVAAEVALAMTLLTGAGLLIRTAWHVQHVATGFDPHRLFVGRLVLPGNRYADSSDLVAAYERIDRAVLATPGVTSAGLTALAPLSASGYMHTSVGEPGSNIPEADRPTADFRLISPGLFAALGLPRIAGRDFNWTDTHNAPPVAIVSASLARTLWPGAQTVIGKRITVLDPHSGADVVGVVGDLHDASLTDAPRPTIYIPYQQVPGGFWPALQRSLVVVARTAQDPRNMIKPIHRAVMSIDPSLPFADEHTMDEYLRSSVATARFNTLLLSSLGAIALLLASIGIYGVVAYFVSQRTGEIGVRIALGAQRGDIWRLVFARGLAPIASGAAVGIVLSLATARLLREQLFGVAPTDPTTLISVAVLLVIVTVVATLVPARRAMRVPPVVALQGT